MKASSSTWARFNKYLYKYWKLQTAVILFGLITLPLSLFNPYLTKLIIDKAYGNKDLKLFFILAIIGGGIFVFNGFINSLSDYLSRRINRRVHFDITKDIFSHLQSLPISFFNARATGEHIYRTSSDVDLVSRFVCNTIPEIITLFPRFLFILIIVFYLNWKLALFASLLVPISFIQPYFFGKWLREITRKMLEKSQGIFRGLQEVFSHIHLVKALGKEDYEIKRFEEALTKRIDFELKDARLSSLSSFSSSVLNKVISGIIALYGGYQVIKGTMTLGSLSAVMIYLTQLLGIMQSIGRFYETTIVNSVACGRLAEILDIKHEIKNRENAIDYRISKGRIEFKEVSFEYKNGESILKGMNFSIAPASKIALVGSSGCGKTTLLTLILRLYEPKEGSILIDGFDIKEMKLESLREQIGIALQEPFLWNDTVENNIRYGKLDADKEEITEIAKLCGVDEFVNRLPNSYQTLIGENACKISEGEKQKIAIARALIKNPKILILDESMSSMDSQSEEKIIARIRQSPEILTVIVVSHRLSTVMNADKVYFLHKPDEIIIANGWELFSKNKAFYDLFAAQIKNYSPEKESKKSSAS